MRFLAYTVRRAIAAFSYEEVPALDCAGPY
jgi:hypothetical protein